MKEVSWTDPKTKRRVTVVREDNIAEIIFAAWEGYDRRRGSLPYFRAAAPEIKEVTQ